MTVTSQWLGAIWRGACLLWLASAIVLGADYDPLAAATEDKPCIVDLTVRDLEQQRDIPIRVFLPQDGPAAPLILFSHGLGGSREGNGFLGTHWAARGYAAVFLQAPRQRQRRVAGCP